ncbi:unnamed protein product [Pseudo-nitzschia multistriata]|uniref:Uncharacterized protein n=1 Tax=Pseudo-nitzschia multistriata TaxID=183589 RepID=A0A448ZQZ0_9STRA|nr:unnamed protein product [Pseudo-nitzschia multistriata]
MALATASAARRLTSVRCLELVSPVGVEDQVFGGRLLRQFAFAVPVKVLELDVPDHRIEEQLEGVVPLLQGLWTVVRVGDEACAEPDPGRELCEAAGTRVLAELDRVDPLDTEVFQVKLVVPALVLVVGRVDQVAEVLERLAVDDGLVLGPVPKEGEDHVLVALAVPPRKSLVLPGRGHERVDFVLVLHKIEADILEVLQVKISNADVDVQAHGGVERDRPNLLYRFQDPLALGQSLLAEEDPRDKLELVAVWVFPRAQNARIRDQLPGGVVFLAIPIAVGVVNDGDPSVLEDAVHHFGPRRKPI